MMNLFQKSSKIFFRSWNISIVALLSVVISVIYLVTRFMGYTLHNSAFLYLNDSLFFSFAFFILNLYIGYEYFYKIKKNDIEECISAQKNGLLKTYAAFFCMLTILPIITFFIYLISNFVVAYINHVTAVSYYQHVFWVLVIYIFLLGILANMTGACLALKLNRLSAYSLFALIIFVLSPVSEMIPGITHDSYGINIWPAKEIFSDILPPNLTWTIDVQYGISYETFRWNLIFFWIFSVLAIFFFTVSKQKKNVVTGMIAFVFAAANLYGYFLPHFRVKMGPYPDDLFMLDYGYYSTHEQREKEADFEILTYTMDFKIDRVLEAVVDMDIKSLSNHEYFEFTLYRGYEVNKIVDNLGNPLAFSREGDYITVDGNENLTNIKISYHGYSPVFYSSNQGVCLPSFFPYYPMPGFLNIYCPSEEGGAFVKNENDLSEFKVYIKGGKNVYTNLNLFSETAGVFEGKSTGLSIMGGLITYKNEDGYHIYNQVAQYWGSSPIDSGYLNRLQNEINKIEQEEGAKKHLTLKDKKIFQSPETIVNRATMGISVWAENHVFIMSGNDSDLIKEIAYNLVKENNHA